MVTPDYSLLEKLRKGGGNFGGGAPPLPPGGDGPTFGDMEHRVARLEDDMREIRSDLKALRVDMAEMKGRVASLPTTWQMITLVFGILGGAFVIIRFGLPHIAG